MKNQRTQHVVDRSFQVRVATSLTAIAMLVPVVLLVGGYLIWTLALIHDPGLADLPFGWKLVGNLLKDQWWQILFIAGSFLAFSFALVFYYTHRIAGPVYRFRWLFDELSEGRIHTRVQLRKGDCFENLASGILRANATLASSVTRLKTAAAAASQEAEALQNGVLREQMTEINRVLDRFSVMLPAAQENAETGLAQENRESEPAQENRETGGTA